MKKIKFITILCFLLVYGFNSFSEEKKNCRKIIKFVENIKCRLSPLSKEIEDSKIKKKFNEINETKTLSDLMKVKK